jgi:hypothetical protein
LIRCLPCPAPSVAFERREAAVVAATRPPSPDDCGPRLGPSASPVAASRARPVDSSVPPGRIPTCSEPGVAQRDCGWKSDVRVASPSGLTANDIERSARPWDARDMAHLGVEIGALTRVPPLRILPVPPAPPRSRHPFRAGHRVRAARLKLAGQGGRLVQGALRSPGCALGTRSRCVRGTQAGSGYLPFVHPRGPPPAVLVNSDLTFIGLLMEVSGALAG